MPQPADCTNPQGWAGWEGQKQRPSAHQKIYDFVLAKTGKDHSNNFGTETEHTYGEKWLGFSWDKVEI